MLLKPTLLLLLALPLCTATAIAQQTYNVSGVVKSDKEELLETVNVSLLNASDSTWLQSVLTNEKGGYHFEHVATGKYIIDANIVGYAPVKQPLNVLGEVSGFDIVLKQKKEALEEVVVSGRNDIIRTELGKTILDVGKEAKEGTNLLELLNKLPGVRVTPNGDISVQGKQGVVVLINDKPTRLSGNELRDYLKSVIATDVKNVELMTQPSAKYDAEGNVAIVNVKMKENKKNGWSGNANLRYSQGLYPIVSGNSTVYYRKDKLNLYATPSSYGGANYLKRSTAVTSQDGNGNTITSNKENSFLKETYSDYTLKVGADYDWSDKTKIGGYVQGIYHPNNEVDVSTTTLSSSGQPTIMNDAINYNGHLRKLYYANAYLDHEINDKQKLTAQADFFRTDKKLYQKLRGYNYTPDGTYLSDGLLLNTNIPVLSDLYGAQADYTAEFDHKKLEAGVKTSYVKIDAQNLYDIYEGGVWHFDSTRSNRFLYDESISAAYVNGTASKGKFDAQAGLRAELTVIKGEETYQGESFMRKWLSLFPTAFISYKADSNNTVELNYGRRIKRPYYRELNPFIRYASQYSYNVGNPYLLPSYTHNIELKHNYKNKLISAIKYAVTNQGFMTSFTFDPTTNITVYSSQNNASSRSISFSEYWNMNLTKQWVLTTSGQVWYSDNYGVFNNQQLYAAGYGYNVNVDTQLSFNHGWHADMQIGYTSAFVTDVITTIGDSVWMSATASKSFFNDTTTVKVNINDPFHLYRYKPTYNTGMVTSSANMDFNSQGIALVLAYNFGKRDENKQRNAKSDALERM